VNAPAPRVEEQSPRVAAPTEKQTAPPNKQQHDRPDIGYNSWLWLR
jgi:hypothetical protein